MLKNKIKVGVIGLGYVGLPIFIRLNRKFKTIGFLQFIKKTKIYLRLNSLFKNVKYLVY